MPELIFIGYALRRRNQIPFHLAISQASGLHYIIWTGWTDL
ncbi:MAG: hypothetical protein ACOCNC_09945 [Acetivibrio ethanolgignens]